MCGLAGVAALSGVLPPGVSGSLRAMTDAIRHRGPDGDGFFSDAFAALGHRRLAIIDRAGGDQPIANEDRSCWIVFNGEIYNHHSLRERLVGRGHLFRTRSDTEAILHAYEEYGPDCVHHLEGMFAFAIYDQRKRELFIARDRLGKKPLFYAVLGGVLHFGSEIKTIQQSPLWNGTLDFDQLESYLSLGYFLAPATVYRHVRKLEPGHWLHVCDGRVRIAKYWDIDRFDDWTGDEEAAVALLDAQLTERVSERLESEVPLGAFLSGGIDSGLVVSSMAESQTQKVVTTTVGFGEAAHNELDLAQLTANRYATTHYTHTIAPRLDEVFDGIIRGFDEPFADASSIPTWYVSKEARRHVTVALSGDGGDETFGGYDFRYIPHALEDRVRRLLPGSAVRGAVGWLGASWPNHRLPRPLRLGTYLENISHGPEASYYADLCFLKPDRARALMGRAPSRDPRDSAVYDAVTAPYLRCSSSSVVQRAEYADLKIYLANDVLVKVDRMSMQHSLEVRCPLLDRRLVELAFRLPQTLKRADRRGKHLLKRLAEKRLPPELLHAPKHGFTAPIGEWIRGPFAGQFSAEVLSGRAHVASLIDVSFVQKAFDDHRRGQRDNWYLLWAVWVLERWAAAQPPMATPAEFGAPVAVGEISAG
jgi:asparagine synthase (glutamine-hydrolysing)